MGSRPISHRRSVGGTFSYAGGSLPPMPLSSHRSQLNWLNSLAWPMLAKQLHPPPGSTRGPTEIQVDRVPCKMATAQQPTRRTRHIDMKQFCDSGPKKTPFLFTDWCCTPCSDSMTNRTHQIHEHGYHHGRRRPRYSPKEPSNLQSTFCFSLSSSAQL
jgi:hypothetical protein